MNADSKGCELLSSICNPFLFTFLIMAKCAGMFTRVKYPNVNDSSVKYHVSDLRRKSVRVFKIKDL